jgi:hypothetical protein
VSALINPNTDCTGRWNIVRQCCEHHEGKMRASIYRTSGDYVAADQAGWLPEVWATHAEALAGVRSANGITTGEHE